MRIGCYICCQSSSFEKSLLGNWNLANSMKVTQLLKITHIWKRSGCKVHSSLKQSFLNQNQNPFPKVQGSAQIISNFSSVLLCKSQCVGFPCFCASRRFPCPINTSTKMSAQEQWSARSRRQIQTRQTLTRTLFSTASQENSNCGEARLLSTFRQILSQRRNRKFPLVIIKDQMNGIKYCKKEKHETFSSGKSDPATCRDSKRRPFAYRVNALPTELQVTVSGEQSSNSVKSIQFFPKKNTDILQ